MSDIYFLKEFQNKCNNYAIILQSVQLQDTQLIISRTQQCVISLNSEIAQHAPNRWLSVQLIQTNRLNGQQSANLPDAMRLLNNK
jgi:hypothetical protein